MKTLHRLAAATTVATAALTAAAEAAIVGKPATFTWTSSTATVDSRTFIVSSLLPEYYASFWSGGPWFAVGVDVREGSVTFSFDSDAAFDSVFTQSSSFRLAFQPNVSLSGASITSADGMAGLAPGAVSVNGNELVVDVSGVGFTPQGASFTVGFSSSIVPGPSALVALAAIAALPRARRR